MDSPFQVAHPIHVPSWWSTFSPPPSIMCPISRTHRNLSGFIPSFWRLRKKAYIITQKKYGTGAVQFVVAWAAQQCSQGPGLFPSSVPPSSLCWLWPHACFPTAAVWLLLLCVATHMTRARFYIAILGVPQLALFFFFPESCRIRCLIWEGSMVKKTKLIFEEVLITYLGYLCKISDSFFF